MANTYSLADLASAAGLTINGVRNLVKTGLMPHALSSGTSAHYTDEHLAIARRVVALRRAGTRGPALARQLAAEAQERAAGGEAAAQRATPALRDAVDALVAVAAEALDMSPRALRPALARVFRRLHDRQLSALRVAAVLEESTD